MTETTDVLARLEAWHAIDPIGRAWLMVDNEVSLRDDRPDSRIVVRNYHFPYGSLRRHVYLGTPERNATLRECIAHALDLWDELHARPAADVATPSDADE